MSFYTSLDYSEEEIRLLRVDTSEAQQHELISNVALRSKRQQYVALSYTWGDQSRQSTISLNGQAFPVSGNLDEALHRVRAFWIEKHGTDGKPLLLWCDQICINQSSDDEKNHQVAYMSQIYKRAELVLISLPVPPSVSAGYKDWSQWKGWHEQQARAADLPGAYSSPGPMTYAKDDVTGNCNPLISAWENVKDIVESKWWSRAWVYQEFMLGTRTTFLIAGLAAPWNELRGLLQSFFSRVNKHQEALSAAVTRADQAADHLELEATNQWHERAKIEQEADKYSAGCGARCHTEHQKYKQSMTTSWNPCRKGSLFRYVRRKTCDICDYDDDDDDVEKNYECVLNWGVAFVCCKIWCPLATLEWMFVSVAVPLAYVCTLVPCSSDKQGEYDVQHEKLGKQADDKQNRASELKRLAKERLAPHNTTIIQANHAWGIANSILSGKGEMMGTGIAPLSQLMRHARNCECQDRRDKVFAFLGITDQSYGLVADYSPSNTLHDVVTEATAAVIRTEKSLNILHDAKEDSIISRASDHLPSWVPNFTTPDVSNVEYQRFIEGIQLPSSGLSASKRLLARASFRADRYGNPNRILLTRGVRVGRLTRIIRDREDEPWRMYEDDSGLKVGTRSNAILGDEVWVLFGADVPFVLSRPSEQDKTYQILAQAMIWEGEKPSSILYGSMIDRLERGEVSDEEVWLV